MTENSVISLQSTRTDEMTDEQRRLAAQAVTQVVVDACSGSDQPTSEALKALAESVAKAMRAGFDELNRAN